MEEERELSLEELDKVCMYNADREFVIEKILEYENDNIFGKKTIERLKEEREFLRNMKQTKGKSR